jgi:hypothetical protein
MGDHKPTAQQIKSRFQPRLSNNQTIKATTIGNTIYERQEGVFRRIGWRLSYIVQNMVFVEGEMVIDEQYRISSVWLE